MQCRRWICCAFCFVFSAIAVPAMAQSVSFESISDRAIKNSYDMALGQIDVGLAKNKIKQAKVPFYPTLSGSINAEYVGALGDQNSAQNQAPVVVGNTILPGNARFQNAIALSSTYTLADFGTRANQLKASKFHAESTIIQQRVNCRELKLSVLDSYTEALLASKELNTRQEQLKLYTQMLENKVRMNKAGRASMVDVGEQAIVRSNAEKDIQDLRLRLGEQLNKLSAFTHESYNIDAIQLTEFDPEGIRLPDQVFPHGALADVKAYQLLIDEKQAEMKSIRAQAMPQLSLFGTFVLYGANKANWVESVGNINARQIYMGLGVALPIFDGYKNNSLLEEKHLEMTQVMVQRDKKLWQIRKDYERSAAAAALYNVEMHTTAQLIDHSQNQLTMVIRLTDRKMEEKTKALSEQIDLLSKQLDEEKVKIQRLASVMRLRIYQET